MSALSPNLGSNDQYDFNKLIGETNFILSSLLLVSKQDLDEVNRLTLEFHLDQLISVAEKARLNLKRE